MGERESIGYDEVSMREREGEKGESVCEGGKKKVGGWLGV